MALYFKINTEKDPLALRSGKGTTTEKIASIPKGAIVMQWAVGDTSDPNWTPVVWENKYGFVSSSYIVGATEADYNNYMKYKDSVISPSTTDTTDNSSENKEEEYTGGKTWMIAGGVALALGAVLNMIM